MEHEEANQENEILLDLEQKEVESMPNLEVILPIASHSHSYPLHCPSLGIKVNNTKQALFSLNEQIQK